MWKRTLPVKESLSASLEQNKQTILEKLGNSQDIVIREFKLGANPKISVAVFYTDGLTDTVALQMLIDELLGAKFNNIKENQFQNKNSLLDQLKNLVLNATDVKEISDLDAILVSLLSGSVIFLVDGQTEGFEIGLRKWNQRSITESTNDSVIRGPKESFTENLRSNTALIRRKIKSPNLWMESRVIGTVTQTDVAIMYLEGTVDQALLTEVKSRLDRIEIDGILESGYIEELIQDEALTPFPTLYNSERPDVVASAILEGRVAILVDGTPFVLLAPALFVQFFQAAEDYYARAGISSALRVLRYMCFLIAFLAPSLFIAITTFHQEMIPSDLLLVCLHKENKFHSQRYLRRC